jgi:hypothetical protein
MVQKVKIDKKNRFDEFGCKRIKNENTSMEAENELLMSKCARAINDLNRKRQTLEYVKDKLNEETAVIAELSMILVISSFFSLPSCAFVSSIH